MMSWHGSCFPSYWPFWDETTGVSLNTLRLRQNGRHFADDICKGIFLNETAWIPIKISLKFVSQGPINNIPALVKIMAWRRPGDKPLSGPMMVWLPTHICVTRPQWVNQATVMRSFGVLFDVGLYKLLNSRVVGDFKRHDIHFTSMKW